MFDLFSAAVSNNKEKLPFLCGRCCFDLNMTFEERKNMIQRIENGRNICSRCGAEKVWLGYKWA